MPKAKKSGQYRNGTKLFSQTKKCYDYMKMTMEEIIMSDASRIKDCCLKIFNQQLNLEEEE